MPQSIPLATALRIKRPDIIIHDPRRLVDQLLVEGRTGEVRLVGARVHRQWSIRRDARPGADLLGSGGEDTGWRQAVQRA